VPKVVQKDNWRITYKPTALRFSLNISAFM